MEINKKPWPILSVCGIKTSIDTNPDFAPSHPIRNRLLRPTADSPDILAVIKQEGRV